MTADSPATPRRARRMPRVPRFCQAPIRSGRDGWTVPRQAALLGMLAETGSVAGACEAVGTSRKSACALRARPGTKSFAVAWDAALGLPLRKVTVNDFAYLAFHGWVRPMLFRGRYRGISQVIDSSALLRLFARLERVAPEDG